MILQALCAYYDALAARGEVSPPGWCDAKVSFALSLGENGELRDILSLKVSSADQKKEVPQIMRVPEQVKRATITPNFLCDNSTYFLGVDEKGKPDRSEQCFQVEAEFHKKLLQNVQSTAAKAVYAFFERWRPSFAGESTVLSPYLKELFAGANMVFWVGNDYAHNDPAIRAAWQAWYENANTDAICGRCLVTGSNMPIARIHPTIKGVQGAQSAGATLVSFNSTAFESYGHQLADDSGQGYNAPVSKSAAFAYGTALNALLADREHLQYVGDTALLCWAEDAQPLCQDVFCGAAFGMPSERVSAETVRSVVRDLAQGKPVDINGIPLRPENRFFVLGIAPNAARLSVRFFLQNTFGRMLFNLEEHYDRLKMAKPAYIEDGDLPLWKLMRETANLNSRDKKPSSPMAAATLRAILTGSSYPVSLIEQTILRIRAEQIVTYGRAAILKAFLLHNDQFHIDEEVLTVELNEQSDYLPYVLGRLFAVLERVQSAANPGLNATIKDKYFNSASATPAVIFPLLTKLSQSHLRKLETGYRIYFEKLIGELNGRIGETLPMRLPLPEQGAFHLGYYHQTQKFFESKQKEENDHV